MTQTVSEHFLKAFSKDFARGSFLETTALIDMCIATPQVWNGLGSIEEIAMDDRAPAAAISLARKK